MTASSASRRWPTVLAVLVGAGAIVAVVRAHDRPAPPPRAAGAETAALAQLRREVAALRGAVARAPTASPTPPAAEANAPPPPDEDPTPPAADAPPAAVIAEQTMLLEDRLAAGDSDPDWSRDATRRIHDRFAETVLTGARLDRAACRGTLCKIELRFESAEALAAGAGDAADSVPWTAAGFVRSDPADPLRLVVYASREGTRLPHPDRI